MNHDFKTNGLSGNSISNVFLIHLKPARVWIRAHPGFHLARVQDVQLFGGLFADEDTEVTLTMKRASAPDAAELETTGAQQSTLLDVKDDDVFQSAEST